jgi:SAM-dependent methyltransferase
MPKQPPSSSEHFVDVERLVDELRERVERERAAGRYSEDVASMELRPLVDEPAVEASEQGAPPAAEEPATPRVRYRPELGYSSRRIVGPFLSGFKRLFYRLFFYPLDDLAHQADAAVRELHAALHAAERRLEHAVAQTAERQEALAAERRALGLRLDTLVNQLELADQLEARAREAVQLDVKDLAEGLAGLEATLDRLQLASRLGRLERLARAPQPASAPAAPPAESVAGPGQQMPSFDYMSFENRFRPEASVRERQGAYLEVLGDRRRVVDLGCGRGELVELLREADVSAYGVDLEPDFVAIGQEKGLEILQGDAIAHVEGLEPGAVDGIVASHVIEHLSSDQLWRLIAAAAETLAPGGVIVLETPNPESVLAGSVNFHRDPTHVRPIHPDTLSFLCESAGFSRVEIQRLSPVPEVERLPQPASEGGSDARPLSEVVTQLNELLYGFQDYAVIARA